MPIKTAFATITKTAERDGAPEEVSAFATDWDDKPILLMPTTTASVTGEK
jgi:hypothetical protein